MNIDANEASESTECRPLLATETKTNLTTTYQAKCNNNNNNNNTVEPRLSGLVGTSVKSPDNRESG